MDQDRIVAVGLLTDRDLTLLGPTFNRLWPVDKAPKFTELLRAIDRADRELRHAKLCVQRQ
jgi:hypothetical protein